LGSGVQTLGGKQGNVSGDRHRPGPVSLYQQQSPPIGETVTLFIVVTILPTCEVFPCFPISPRVRPLGVRKQRVGTQRVGQARGQAQRGASSQGFASLGRKPWPARSIRCLRSQSSSFPSGSSAPGTRRLKDRSRLVRLKFRPGGSTARERQGLLQWELGCRELGGRESGVWKTAGRRTSRGERAPGEAVATQPSQLAWYGEAVKTGLLRPGQ
jgi:hypothetical protein